MTLYDGMVGKGRNREAVAEALVDGGGKINLDRERVGHGQETH